MKKLAFDKYPRRSLTCLYRDIHRRLNRILNSTIPPVSEVPDTTYPRIKHEIEAANTNPDKYLRHLLEEFKYNTKNDFKKPARKSLDSRYARATDLLEILDEYNYSSQDFETLLRFKIKYNEEESRQSEIIAQTYLANGIREFDGVIPKERQRKFAFPLLHYRALTNDKRETRLKEELETSDENKQKIIRRYLKHLQMHNKLAVPHLLPYTTIQPLLGHIKKSSKIYKSTSIRSMREAYNQDMIETVILPEIEHNVNYYHYLKKVEHIVNTKGPYQVKIRQSYAGSSPIGFVKVPFKRLTVMREIAMDIKKLVQATNIKNLWLSKSDEQSTAEKRQRDGSFDISWNKSYGPNQKMYSLEYYRELHLAEAEWEFRLAMHSLRGQDENGQLVDAAKYKQDLIEIKKVYTDSWMNLLDFATHELSKDASQYSAKYDSKYLNRLRSERDMFQERLNGEYNRYLANYGNLVSDIERKRVLKHSDLVDDIVLEGTSDRHLMANDSRVKKSRTGMACNDRVGLGKRLSNYMEENNLPHYKIGKKFEKKFEF